MPDSVTSSTPRTESRGWIYTDLTVISEQGTLKPTHLASDYLIFSSPPHLEVGPIEIVMTEGTDVRRWTATVLPHEPDSLRVPMKLDQ